jgi:hypothetical protein
MGLAPVVNDQVRYRAVSISVELRLPSLDESLDFQTSCSDNLPVKSGMPSDIKRALEDDVFQVRYGGAVE